MLRLMRLGWVYEATESLAQKNSGVYTSRKAVGNLTNLKRDVGLTE